VDSDETTFAWDWATAMPEMLRQGDTLYLVGLEILGRANAFMFLGQD
jgi:hypothetical protein